MSCDRYEVLLRLAPASLLGLEERKQLERHFKECPTCTLKSRELQLSYSALKAPLEPYKLDEDRIFEGILEAQSSQPLTKVTKAPDPLRISLSCCYCHDKLARAEAVYCASCLSPHHRDCFKEHGLCSAIGCQERQTVTPQLEVRARPRHARRRTSFFLGSALALSATLLASYAIHELYSSWREAHESLARAEFELLQKEESLQHSRAANTQLLLKSGEAFKKEREMRRLLQVERSRGVISKAKRDALESERQSLMSRVHSLERRRRELNLALSSSDLKRTEYKNELERLRPLAKQKQRSDAEAKRLRAESKALKERGDFELRYFEQQVLFLHGRRSAEDIARAGRLPQLLRKLDSEMSSRRVPIIDEIAKIGPSATYAITPLIKRLKDNSLQVRLAAINALRAIGPAADKAVGALRKLYQDCEGDPLGFESNEIDRLRVSLLQALGDFGPAAFAALPEFKAGLGSGQSSYRLAALQSLTKLATRKRLREKQEQAIRQSLRREMISLDFDGVSMKEALDFIGRFLGVEVVSSPAFQKAVRSRRSKVYMRLKLVRVSNALGLVLSNEAAEFKVSGGRIVVLQAGESLSEVEAQLRREDPAPRFRESVLTFLKAIKPGSEQSFAKDLEESLKKIEAAAKSD